MELLRSGTTDPELASRGESGTHVIPRDPHGSRENHGGGSSTPLFDALEGATMSEPERRAARDLLVADLDAADDELEIPSTPAVSSGGTRLARAVARTTLDAWRRGEVDGERVAEAYADLASRVVHAA